MRTDNRPDRDIAFEALTWDRGAGKFVPLGSLPDRRSAQFLKGPVDWDWIIAASRARGRALEVGLCLWRLAGVMKTMTVRLATKEVEPLGIDRYAKARALAALEKAGLIRVERKRGRFPVVTIVLRSTDAELQGGSDFSGSISVPRRSPTSAITRLAAIIPAPLNNARPEPTARLRQ